jgi:hypothetical protein
VSDETPLEPDLFAGQAPPPTPEPEVPRCPECTLKLDKSHTTELCLDWSTWRKRERLRFEALGWSITSVDASPPAR